MQTGTILIVDDEIKLRELYDRILSLEGFKTFTAGNIKDGLAILDNEQIQLVITDVKLPDGDGVSFTEKIKKAYPLTEVILITAYSNVQDGVKAMKLGAYDYIAKG